MKGGNYIMPLMDTYNGLVKDMPQHLKVPVSGGKLNTSRVAYRTQCVSESEKLVDDCCKKVVVDIYVKCLPFDDQYKAANPNLGVDDVDAMLSAKNMTATQYFKSACEATGAPMLEHVWGVIQEIGKTFVEEAMEVKDEADEKGVGEEVTPPKSEDQDIDSKLVDVTGDMEYEDFIEKLKKKTINAIVADISALIIDRKKKNDMKFDPAPEQNDPDQANLEESTFVKGVTHITRCFLKEGWDLPENQDPIFGLAIRESVLNEVGRAFNLGLETASFDRMIKLGKGVVITEAAIVECSGKVGGAISSVPGGPDSGAIGIDGHKSTEGEDANIKVPAGGTPPKSTEGDPASVTVPK